MKNYPNWLPARLPIGFFYEKIRKMLFKQTPQSKINRRGIIRKGLAFANTSRKN
jgi:hypothetical protein